MAAARNRVLKMAKAIEALDLDWICFNNLDDQETASGPVVLNMSLVGPDIPGRAVQPYSGGTFYVTVDFTGFDEKAPAFKFLTKIWHPLVNYETQEMCKEAIPELWLQGGYRPTPEAVAANRLVEPMLSAFRLLQDLLLKVHERGGSAGVNSDAMAELAKDEGRAFDEHAGKVTQDYARQD